jgi:hypothetical protein
MADINVFMHVRNYIAYLRYIHSQTFRITVLNKCVSGILDSSSQSFCHQENYRKYLVLISKYPSESLVDLFGQLDKQLNCFNLPSRSIEHLAMKSATIPTTHQDTFVVQHPM